MNRVDKDGIVKVDKILIFLRQKNKVSGFFCVCNNFVLCNVGSNMICKGQVDIQDLSKDLLMYLSDCTYNIYQK